MKNKICSIAGPIALIVALVSQLSLETWAAEASRPETNESFIAIDAMNISIIKDLRVRGMLQVEIGLDVPDEDLRETALILYPRLQNAYVMALRYYTGNRLPLFTTPDVFQIATLLQQVTDEVLHRPGARVLLSQVMVHKPY